jgi:hypothetical protein
VGESKKIEKGKEVTWEAMRHRNGNKASIPTPLHGQSKSNNLITKSLIIENLGLQEDPITRGN